MDERMTFEFFKRQNDSKSSKNRPTALRGNIVELEMFDTIIGLSVSGF